MAFSSCEVAGRLAGILLLELGLVETGELFDTLPLLHNYYSVHFKFILLSFSKHLQPRLLLVPTLNNPLTTPPLVALYPFPVPPRPKHPTHPSQNHVLAHRPIIITIIRLPFLLRMIAFNPYMPRWHHEGGLWMWGPGGDDVAWEGDDTFDLDAVWVSGAPGGVRVSIAVASFRV